MDGAALNFIFVDQYLLVYNGILPVWYSLFVLYIFYGIGAVLTKKNNLAAMLFFLFFLIMLSLLFSNNGPDKGSYATIFSKINTISDVFSTANTIESPLYYCLMVLYKSVNLPVDLFFVSQNIAISICLFYIGVKIGRGGFHVAFWLWSVHLLVPFSVRAHLGVIFLPVLMQMPFLRAFLLYTISIGIHFFSAIPIVVFRLLYKNNIKHVYIYLVPLVVSFGLIWGSVSDKFIQYTVNSELYFDGSGFSLSFVFDLIEFFIFYWAIKDKERYVSWFLFFPVIVSFFGVFYPFLGRFAFSLDVLYVCILFMKDYRFHKYLLIILSLMGLMRFTKNFITNYYYVI